MSASPNLQLPYLDANQNQKSVTHNEALRRLDALVNLGVEASSLKAPPAAPADGQRWIVAPAATGAWAGRDLNVAAWQDGAWSFLAPGRGTLAYDAAGNALLFWTGTAWRSIASLLALLGVTALGIGTAADAANPLSATLNNALFNALSAGAGGTGDLRVKLNKAAAGNTASFLFQDGFSGRAEIGLAGDDNFHLKVSPDGSAFVDAMVVAAANGAVAFAASPTAPTPAAGDASTRLATTAFVAAAVAALVAAAPGALDTLKELADALGDDPNFAATVASTLSTKAPLASPTLTGTPSAPTPPLGDSSARLATTAFVAGAADPLALSPVAPTLDYRLTAPDCLPPGQFSRLSTGTGTSPAGLLVPVAAGGLRIDHDPVTGAPLGALIEDQRTNLFTSSAGLGTGVATNVTATLNAGTFADGSSSLALLQSSKAGTSNDCYINSQLAVANDGVTRVYSCYLRPGTSPTSLLNLYYSGGTFVQGTALITWSNLAVTVTGGTGGVIPCGLGLYRVWIAVSNNASGNTSCVARVYVRDQGSANSTSDTVSVGGHQLEAGAFPTSYIPTTGAQATRTADSLVVAVTSDWFNPGEGTFYVEASTPALVPANTYPTLFEIGDGTSYNRYVLYLAGSALYFAIFQAGAFAGAQLVVNVQPGQRLRAAVAYGAAGKAMAVLGAAAVGNAMTVLAGFTRLFVGASNGGAAVLGAQVRRVAYIPRALSPAQLQAMTS